jgi:hypothetical protein
MGGTRTTEEYNGFSWNMGGNTIFTVHDGGAIGNPTNAQLLGGGFTQPQSYNGTAWSIDKYFLPNGYIRISVAGQPTAGIVMGGMNGGTGQVTNDVYVDNGTAWETTTPMPYFMGVKGAGAAGTQTATIIVNGDAGTFHQVSRLFDGIAWTTGPQPVGIGTAHPFVGSQTSGMYIGDYGNMSITSRVQVYDGIAFSYGSNRSETTQFNNGGGSVTDAIAFGGSTAQGVPSTTEIYNAGYDAKPIITYSADNGFLILSQVSQSLDFADDAAAAAGNVPLGGLYHSSGTIKIRLV